MITLGQVAQAKEPMVKIAALPFDVRTAYAVSRLIKRLDAELETFEQLRLGLFEKHGEKNEDGTLTVKEKNLEKFRADMAELLALPAFDGEEIKPITAKYPESGSVSAAELLACDKFIKFEE